MAARLPVVRQASSEAFPHPVPPDQPARRRNLSAPEVSNLDLWAFYNVPEVKAISLRVASGVRRVNFRPCVNIEGSNGDRCPPLIGEDGELADGVSPRLAEACAEIWATVQSPSGNQSDLFGSLATALTVAGDAWQFGYPGTPEMRWDPDGEPMWVGIARSAVTELNQEYVVQVGIDGPVKVPSRADAEGHGTAIRIWHQNPQAPALADCWMNACVRPLQILTSIYEAVAAVALSRMNAGIILAPDDQDQLVTPGAALVPGGLYPLGTDLKQQLYDGIGDHIEASAQEVDGWSRAAPAVFGMNSALTDKVKWLELARNMDPQLGERIDDLRHRIYQVCPLPPEVAEGMATISGLGGGNVAEQIDRSEYQRAILPVCEDIAWPNTKHILRAELAARGFSPVEQMSVRIGYTANNLLMPPDRSDSAIKVAALPPTSVLLGPADIREATGLGEFEAPEDDEVYRATVLWLCGQSPEYKTLLPSIGIDLPAETVADPEEVVDIDETDEPDEPDPDDTAQVASGALPSAALRGAGVGDEDRPVPSIPAPRTRQAAAGEDRETGYRLVEIATRYEERLATLVEAIIARLTERASSRVASLARSAAWADLRQSIRDANAVSPNLLGAVPGVLPKLQAEGVDDGDLFEPALATFAPQFETLTRRHQRATVRELDGDWDELAEESDEANAAAWGLLGTLLVAEARRRFEGRLPDVAEGEGALSPFGVPSDVISRVSATAGGLLAATTGGPESVLSAPWTSIATGPISDRAARQAERVRLGFLWDWRYELERNPFPPHQDMHGVFGFNEDDFDGEAVGDHVGCLCAYVPVYGAI